MGWSDIVSGIFKPVSDVIEHVLPSGDAKIQLQQKILEAQMAAAEQTMDYERQLLDSQSKVILAEAQGSSWLQRNWRPLMMVFFAGLIGARWFGFSAPNMTEAEAMELWAIVKIGISGYIIGRSVEQTAPHIANAFNSKGKDDQ